MKREKWREWGNHASMDEKRRDTDSHCMAVNVVHELAFPFHSHILSKVQIVPLYLHLFCVLYTQRLPNDRRLETWLLTSNPVTFVVWS
jgi:hypothetical protein